MVNHLMSPPERAAIEEARSKTKDKAEYTKLSVLVMLDEGMTLETIAVSLGIGIGTVHNWKKKYESGGLKHYLDSNYRPYEGKLDDEALARLDAELERKLYTNCAEIGRWITQAFGVSYSESAIQAILKKLGYSYKKTVSVPGGVDVAEQAAFLKEMEPFVAEKSEDDVVYFMDGVHPQHNTRNDYGWIKSGERFEIPSNSGRKRLNLNGAVNAHDVTDVEVVEAETVNAQSTIDLLNKLLAKHPDKTDIYVFCDNAPYYKSAVLKDYLKDNPKLKLIHLPPYSPNLNLIERLWRFMRKTVINLKFYPTFKDFRDAILQFFETIGQYKKELTSLLQPNFQRFSAAPTI